MIYFIDINYLYSSVVHIKRSPSKSKKDKNRKIENILICIVVVDKVRGK